MPTWYTSMIVFAFTAILQAGIVLGVALQQLRPDKLRSEAIQKIINSSGSFDGKNKKKASINTHIEQP